MKYRVALVEYLNTLPFYEGLKMTGMNLEWEIYPVSPASCAQYFKDNKVDISLCPVGALDEMPDHEIVGKYCIGADGPVKTVMLLSKVPLEEISSVRLDPNSRTSNGLLQILAKHLWKKEWKYYAGENGVMTEARVMIGDKVFDQESNYPYRYDLAASWKDLTTLPMVFAVWIANPDVTQKAIRKIDDAFEKGFDVVKQGGSNLEDWQVDYLKNSISYAFDDNKRKALELYLDWKRELNPITT